MKMRMEKTLRFWIDCEYHRTKGKYYGWTKNRLLADILRRWELGGSAMRHLDNDGVIAWKATPDLLSHLADAEAEAREDLEDM